MYKYLILLILIGLFSTSCKPSYTVTKVIKPKKHLFVYNPKWHKKAKRTHYVKLKH
jgi:hypothetical protein